MTTTATTTRYACTAPTPTQGFQLPCPYCGEQQANMSVSLADLDGAAFHCQECDSDFSFNEVRVIINKWAAMLDRLSAFAAAFQGDVDGMTDEGMPAE